MKICFNSSLELLEAVWALAQLLLNLEEEIHPSHFQMAPKSDCVLDVLQRFADLLRPYQMV